MPMSDTASCGSAPQGVRWGRYKLCAVARGDSTAGCGRGVDELGAPVFLRWGPADPAPGRPNGPVAEYECLSLLCDRAAPRALDLVWCDSSVVCVTEWIDGTQLGAATDDLVMVVSELARVLKRAHFLGFVHGDVKHLNVLRRTNGSPVLVDWETVRTIGSEACPGTLGYAPPNAWEPGYTAQPENDLYSLSVLARELTVGRPTFSGLAHEIIEHQRSGDAIPVEHPRPCEPVTFDAVSGVHSCEPSLLELLDSIADPPIRVDVRLAATVAAHPDVVAACAGAAPLRTQFDLGHARLHEVLWGLRVHRRTNVISATDLRAWADSMSVSDADAARPTESTVAVAPAETGCVECVAGALVELGRVVIVCAMDSDPAERTIVDALLEFSQGVRSGGAIRLLTLRERGETPDETGAAAGAVRAAVAYLLCRRDVPDDVVSVLVSAACSDEAGVIRGLRTLITAGLLSQDAERMRSAPCPELAAALGSPGVNCGRDATFGVPWVGRLPFDLVLSRGCAAARSGHLAEAYRAAVRSTTTVLLSLRPRSQDVIAVADLWLELCRFRAAKALLELSASWTDGVDRLTRLGRIALALGNDHQLAALGSELHQHAVSSGDLVMAARLQAVADLGTGRVRAASRALRQARASLSTADAQARLEYCITLANIARVRGHRRLARVLLNRTHLDAEQAGLGRIAVLCEANLLLADRTQPIAVRAEEWEGILERARATGAWDRASYAAALAAHGWLAAGGPDRARVVLARWELEEPYHETGERVASLLNSARASVADWDERLNDVERICASRAATKNLSLRRELIAAELGAPLAPTPAGSTATHSVLFNTRSRRCRRLAHWNELKAVSRLTRLVRIWEQRLGSDPGLSLHSARQLRGFAPCEWAKALDNLRRDADQRPTSHEFILGLHAYVLAHGLSFDAKSVAWFRDEAATDVSRRSLGIRRWEWALATAFCARDRGCAVGDEYAVLARAMHYLSSLCATLAPESAARYWDAAPWRTIEESIGIPRSRLGADDGYQALPFDDPAVAQAWRSSRAIGRREADLKRVLQSALRLRSTSGLSEVLEETVRGLLSVTNAERAVVLFETSPGSVRAKVGTVSGVDDLDADKAEISQSILARVRAAVGTVIIDDVSAEDALGDRPSVLKYRPRAVMACPLRTNGRYLGYVYLEHRSQPGSFSLCDSETLEGFASQAALAIENAALVHDLRTSNRALCLARSEAVRAENLRVLGRMATDVAHDLNNLLAAILGEAQLLLTEPRFRDAYSALRVIERAAEDGAECIRRIQDSTRVRSADEFVDVDLARVAQDVLAFTRVRCAARPGVAASEIRVHQELRARARVRGVPSELREVLTNLVVNAIDAMPAGGDLFVSMECSGDTVRLAIRDTGCGIPESVRERLFEPFFSTKGARGNGLGLSIARGVAVRHGGDIEIASQVGVGTEVALRLPRARSDVGAEREPLSKSEPLRPVVNERQQRFLIVDDDASVLRVLEQMLVQSGASVDAAVGGEAALLRLQHAAAPYDCVVTDLYMPQVSGLDVVDRVQRLHPDMPVVLMSGCSTTLEGDAARARNVARLLHKPFALCDVQRLVELAASSAS